MFKTFLVSALSVATVLFGNNEAEAQKAGPDQVETYTVTMVSLVDTFCLVLERKEDVISEAASKLDRSSVEPVIDGDVVRWSFSGPARYRIHLEMKKGLKNAYCRLIYSGGDGDAARASLGSLADRFTERYKMTSRVLSFGAGRADDLGTPVRSWMHEARGGPFGSGGGRVRRCQRRRPPRP